MPPSTDRWRGRLWVAWYSAGAAMVAADALTPGTLTPVGRAVVLLWVGLTVSRGAFVVRRLLRERRARRR